MELNAKNRLVAEKSSSVSVSSSLGYLARDQGQSDQMGEDLQPQSVRTVQHTDEMESGLAVGTGSRIARLLCPRSRA